MDFLDSILDVLIIHSNLSSSIEDATSAGEGVNGKTISSSISMKQSP